MCFTSNSPFCLLLIHCFMWANYTSKSDQKSKTHLFKTFCPSMDECEYSNFESSVIHPSIQATYSHGELFSNSLLSNLPIVPTPEHQSISDTLCFLVHTDYNCLSIIHPPSFEQTTPMPQIIPLDCLFYIEGYFSKKQLDCFIWEAGHFEEVSQVIFGSSGRLG